MVFKTDQRKEGQENKVVPGSVEYREKIKKLMEDETRKTFDEEIQKAAQELKEEEHKALKSIADEYKAAIRQVVEEEKKSIQGKTEALMQSILKMGL